MRTDNMSFAGQAFDVGSFRTTIVACENEQSIVFKAMLLQRRGDFGDHIVGLHHKVTVFAKLAFARPFWRRNNRRVWRTERNI